MSSERCENDPTQTRSTAPVRRMTCATARASSACAPFISTIARAEGNRRNVDFERRHADRPDRETDASAVGEVIPGIDASQLVGRQRLDGPRSIGGAIERRIVKDHGHAVGRQPHVELDTVGAERHAVVERGHGVFRRELGAAAMREDQRPRRLKNGWQRARHQKKSSHDPPTAATRSREMQTVELLASCASEGGLESDHVVTSSH